MTAACFELPGEPGVWQRRIERPGFDGEVMVPVDLIVPAEFVSKAGRHGARLPRGHGKTAARKSDGVEGAVVDFDPFEITPLEGGDNRRFVVNVAGPAALLVAKAYKLGERLEQPERLLAKDAGDVYRLFDATAATEMAEMTVRLLGDNRSAATTRQALLYVRELSATPRSPCIQLAIHALASVVEEASITAVMTGYALELIGLTRS